MADVSHFPFKEICAKWSSWFTHSSLMNVRSAGVSGSCVTLGFCCWICSGFTIKVFYLLFITLMPSMFLFLLKRFSPFSFFFHPFHLFLILFFFSFFLVHLSNHCSLLFSLSLPRFFFNLQGIPGEPGKRGKMGRPVKFCLNILYRQSFKVWWICCSVDLAANAPRGSAVCLCHVETSHAPHHIHVIPALIGAKYSEASLLFGSYWKLFGVRPLHVKIYKACICVIVWKSSVFPWLLEGLTAVLTQRNPTIRRSKSWTQLEKDFCCSKTPPQPPPSPHLKRLTLPPLGTEKGIEGSWHCFIVDVRLHSKSLWQSV